MRKTKETILISIVLFHIIAVPSWAGTLVVWGNNSYGQVDGTPPGDDWVDVSAGGCHIMALREDGSVVAWGDNWFGQCDIPEGTKAVAISAGETFSLWLKSDGSVDGCGDDILGQISDLPTGTDITAIATGGYHSLVLRNDGSLYSCGMDSCGQVSDTPSGNNFVGIACGLEFSVALRDDGTVVGWGDNSSGQIDSLETLTNIKKVSCGWGHTLCMGSVWFRGANDHGQCDVPPDIPLIDGDCGGEITLILLENGQMMTFGWDADGLVSDTPKDGMFKVISAGSYNNAAIKESGVENQPPVADPGGPYDGTVGELMGFDGSNSKDLDGTIVSYHWNFGDGQSRTDPFSFTNHVYAAEGKYMITLTVTDDDDATGEASTEVTINGNNTIHPNMLIDPKKLNIERDGGNVNATIFGGEDFDVQKVDPGSIFLEGIPADKSNIEDFGGPFDLPDNPIPDGYDDLKSQFSVYAIKQNSNKLDGSADGDIVVLRLNGNLFDEYGGNAIEGQDEVVIRIRSEDLIVEDFESYSIEIPIKETWTDGVGYPGNPGNGTGSTLELGSWGANQYGSFSYNNFDWPYYSVISKILDPSQNWEIYGTHLGVDFIGMSATTGSVNYDPDDETYTVTGSGDGIEGTSDKFHIVYKKLNGDGSIAVEKPTFVETNSGAKAEAGIMIRNTLDADSQHVTVITTPNDNVNIITRENEGDKTQSIRIQIDKAQPRLFYRLRREENLFWVEQSDNLINNWSPVKSPNGDVLGPFIIPMNKEVYIGMIVMSGNENATIEVEFTDVSTSGEVSPDGPFASSEDVGIPHNDPAPFYLKVEDIYGKSAIVNQPDDPIAVQVEDWSLWSTPLTIFSDQGVDVTEIIKINVGIGDMDSLEPGGLGMVYIDNIIVYSP